MCRPSRSCSSSLPDSSEFEESRLANEGFQEVLDHRTKVRAYYLSQTEAFLQTVPEGYSVEDWAWTTAALVERQKLHREIEVRAYFLWRDECHRLGDVVVNKNDLHHWFLAEIEILNHWQGRFKTMATAKDNGVTDESSAESAEHSCCASASNAVSVVGEALSGYGGLYSAERFQSKDGEINMKDRKDAHPSLQRPFSAVESMESIDESKIGQTLDLSNEKYRGKVVLTDATETIELVIGDSEDEVLKEAKKPSFVKRLKELGERPNVVIHHL